MLTLEDRIPEKHLLRLIRCIVNELLGALDSEHDAPPGLRDQSAKAETNRGAVRLRPRPATQVAWSIGMISRTCSNKMTSAKPDAVTDLTSYATTDRHKLSAHFSAC
jgi:hypothetical protein